MAFYIVEVDNDGFKVYDSGGTLIDPAKDTTVAAITTELQAIQATTGIKKIIDPLPAGTNNIGDVDLASAIPAGANIIGLIKLVDNAGANVLAIDASGRAAIQDQPNMDVALSTRATEATLSAADGRLTTIDAVLDAIKDTDGVKKITDQLPAGSNEIGAVAQGTKGAAANGWPIVVYDASGNPLALALNAGSLASARGIPVMGKDNADAAQFLRVDGSGRLAVTPSPPTAPPGTTEFSFVVSESELNVGSGGDVSSPHTTVGSIIANGINLFLQSIEVGTEGDSSENGSVIEVFWRTSGPTDHLISRLFVAGQSIQVALPNTNSTRDGTAMTGDGVDTRLVVVRRRLSTAALEIDFVIRGFTE